MSDNHSIRAHGIRCLRVQHPAIRKLKKVHHPSSHGNKIWKTSWLLMDYILKSNSVGRSRVLDIGCGWGLTGIFLAKRFNAQVTGIDIDPDIFPYLELHAKINKVNIDFYNMGFDELKAGLLKKADVIVGNDICFWDELIDPLRRLINRARRWSVKTILLADPGRPTFDDLSDFFIHQKCAELIEWEIQKPCFASGKILKLQF